MVSVLGKLSVLLHFITQDGKQSCSIEPDPVSQSHACKNTGAVVPTLHERHTGPQCLFIFAAFGFIIYKASVTDIQSQVHTSLPWVACRESWRDSAVKLTQQRHSVSGALLLIFPMLYVLLSVICFTCFASFANLDAL